MDKYDFPSHADRTGVYVNFSEKVPLESYLRDYLKGRKMPIEPKMIELLKEWVTRMPGKGPLYKADLDYFLNSNVMREEQRMGGGHGHGRKAW